MKRYIPLLIAGALVLPVIFDVLRQGAIALSLLIAIGIAFTGTLVATRCGSIKSGMASLAFLIGTFLSEMYFLLSWFYTNQSEKLDLINGFQIAFIEGTIISILGASTIVIVCHFTYRIPKKRL